MATGKSKRAANSETASAIEMLRKDHRNVEQLFREFEKADDPELYREVVSRWPARR